MDVTNQLEINVSTAAARMTKFLKMVPETLQVDPKAAAEARQQQAVPKVGETPSTRDLMQRESSAFVGSVGGGDKMRLNTGLSSLVSQSLRVA
eukprot:1955752-Prymnesium_polylepis.1